MVGDYEETKRCRRQRRQAQVAGDVWIRMLGSIPYLSSPTSGSPLGSVLRARTLHRSYPVAEKGTQVPRISQRWTQKWWYGDAERERLTSHRCGAPLVRESWSRPPRRPRLLLRSVPTAQNHGHDCLGPCEFCCTVIAQAER
jgi:hypothetical protein